MTGRPLSRTTTGGASRVVATPQARQYRDRCDEVASRAHDVLGAQMARLQALKRKCDER